MKVTYTELVSTRTTKWRSQIDHMKPGDFKEVDLYGVGLESARSALDQAAKTLGRPIKMRRRDGKLYAVYLKPEDVEA